VDVPGHPGVAGAAGAGLDHRRGRAVLAVRRRLHRDPEAGAIVVAAVQRLEVGDRGGDVLAVRRRRAVPVVEAAGQHDAHAQPLRRLDGRRRVVVAAGVEVVEVAHRGDAVQQHLAEGEQRRGGHAVGIEARRVAVERAVAPLEEGQVVADPAQQRLEAVVVGVDRPGISARPVQRVTSAPAARGSASTAAGSPTRTMAPPMARTAVAP
jgi:hypothetical protein